MKKIRHIGIQAERSRAHGRRLLEGIAEFTRSQYDWHLDLLETEQLQDKACLSKYDGFIVRIMNEATEHSLSETGKPIVDIYGRTDNVLWPTIRLDDTAIAKSAADFFASHLYSSVAYCGFPELRFSQARCEAFVAAEKEYGIDCKIYNKTSRQKIKDFFFYNEQPGKIADIAELKTWINSLAKPTAVFCCNDIRAFQVMKCCEILNIRVPEEIAILGVDNDTLLCSFSSVTISSIETDAKKLGFRAGELLAELFDGRNNQAPRIIYHQPQSVIERASTEIYHSKTEWLSDALIYIQRNIAKGVNAVDVVRHTGYSYTTVNNAFSDECNTTIQREIIRQRLALACKYLQETSDSAANIATMCGFKNPQYFSKVFHDTYGISPDKWRNKINH